MKKAQEFIQLNRKEGGGCFEFEKIF